MDSSDDSQVDIFASQATTKKKLFKTSSAPAPKTGQVIDYKWLIIFKWGGDIDYPFEVVALEDLRSCDYENTWLTGVMSPASRKKYRNLDIYPDFSISVFSKVEGRK